MLEAAWGDQAPRAEALQHILTMDKWRVQEGSGLARTTGLKSTPSQVTPSSSGTSAAEGTKPRFCSSWEGEWPHLRP